MLPERLKQLRVRVDGDAAGVLTRESQYVFAYDRDDAAQAAVSLLMPPTRLVHVDGDLFPAMDMNLPEGFLFQRILERFPKSPLTKMHLLALMSDNGIGRIGFAAEDVPVSSRTCVDRRTLLNATAGVALFDQLLDAYLATSAGVSGVQPKLLVPSRASMSVPDLIVKMAGPDYPGLAANEYLCLDAARHAGIAVSPRFDLSADGTILVIDRFDMAPSGRRIGFEDIAALMGRQVHDRLSDRKYQGSYERVAEVIRIFSSRPRDDLVTFFEQLALSVMLRNGDAHLKNFGLLYTEAGDARLSPLYDVVTTTVYTYQRPGGAEAIDRTLALKWRAGRKGSRAYPDRAELLAFGREACGVRHPQNVVERIAQAMSETLSAATHDDRIAPGLLAKMRPEWESGQALAQD